MLNLKPNQYQLQRLKKVCDTDIFLYNLSNSLLFLDLLRELETPIATEEPDIESMKQSPIQQSRKRALLSLFNHHHHKSSKANSINQKHPSTTTTSLVSELSSTSTTTPYVYIDHEKTTTLKEIANERLQQQQARRVEI
jgi:hypothetical protein